MRFHPRVFHPLLDIIIRETETRYQKKLIVYYSIMIMMAISTREPDFVPRAVGEWRNSSKRVITIIRQ
jgi:hypothetical protein